MIDQEAAENQRLIEAIGQKDEQIRSLDEENKALKDLVQYLLEEISETKDIAKERFKNILYKLS